MGPAYRPRKITLRACGKGKNKSHEFVEKQKRQKEVREERTGSQLFYPMGHTGHASWRSQSSWSFFPPVYLFHLESRVTLL